MSKKRYFLLFSIFLAMILPFAEAAAQQGQIRRVMVQSGTGFFVSGDGYIVTNHHVVDGCTEVHIRGGVPQDKAVVKAVDEQFDLALLKTNARPRRAATIRHPDISRLEVGEPVMLMGYPMDTYKTGQYQVAEATITGLKGPSDEPHWIQFSESARNGNSGGPLFDSAGNVAGVVVATSEMTEYLNGRKVAVRRSDVAIGLKVLMRFLDYNFVTYNYRSSGGYMMANRIEEEARPYIVNVLCERPDLPVPDSLVE